MKRFSELNEQEILALAIRRKRDPPAPLRAARGAAGPPRLDGRLGLDACHCRGACGALVITWIRARYLDTAFLRAAFEGVVGGLIVFGAGILIGNA